MNHLGLLLCVAISFNAILAAIATSVARRCGLQVRFVAPVPVGAMLIATFIQVLAGSQHANAFAAFGIIISIGAVVVCGVTDAQTGYVFDAITLPSGMAVLAFAAANSSLTTAALGAAAGAGSLGFLYAITRGGGLGLGDVKLGCCIGAPLGASDGLTSVGLAFVLGGMYASYLLITRRAGRGDAVRFAPYLAAGMLLITIYRAIS